MKPAAAPALGAAAARRTALSVRAAYLGVILVWSATPLAIKWSSTGVGFLFGVTSRMAIGALCLLLVLAVTGVRLPWHRAALRAYLAGAVGVYGAMITVHWSAQFIPSGWAAMLFGLAPLATAVMAAAWLGEASLVPIKLLGMALGIGGLAVIFASALDLGLAAVLGTLGVLVATTLHSASAVLVKRVNAGLPALCVATGSLLVALPLYVLTWWIGDGHWPREFPLRALASIAYLGIVTTALGFALYYHILEHLAATRVAMISMVAPVLALILGQILNHEPLTLRIAVGAAMTVAALLLHEVAPAAWRHPPRGR